MSVYLLKIRTQSTETEKVYALIWFQNSIVTKKKSNLVITKKNQWSNYETRIKIRCYIIIGSEKHF